MTPTPSEAFRRRANGEDGSYLVVRLAMDPDHRGGVAVLVEGSTDIDLYHAFLEPRRRKDRVLIHAESKEIVLDVARQARDRGIPIVAIVDADDDHVLRRSRPDYVVQTDFRDAEATLFLGEPGDRLIATHLRSPQVEEFEDKYGYSVKDALVRAASVAGAARVVNQRDRLGISFRSASTQVALYVDAESLELAKDRYLEELRRASRRTAPDFSRRVDDVLNDNPAESLVPGHDVVRILAGVAKGPLGHGVAHDREALERALRTACTQAFFRTTRMHRRLRELSSDLPVPLVA